MDLGEDGRKNWGKGGRGNFIWDVTDKKIIIIKF